jgi:glycosyltransferase involved in cell wall biosynthesis
MVANYALNSGFRVAVLTAQPAAIDRELSANVRYKQSGSTSISLEYRSPYFPSARFQPTWQAIAQWAEVARTIKQNVQGSNLVFFPWLDSYLDRFLSGAIVDRIFPFRWAGIYFHPAHLRGISSKRAIRAGWISPDAAIRSKRCAAVGLLDQSVCSSLSARLGGKAVIPFPDYADPSPPDDKWEAAETIKHLAQGRFVVGIVGSLEKRKGLLTALEAARLLEKEPFFFVFAGQLAASTFSEVELSTIREAKAFRTHNCFFCFGEIPDERKFNALIFSCDAIFAAYEKFPHSSNLLSKAALFRKPVIVSKGYYMEEMTKHFGTGISIRDGNPADCLDALRTLRGEELGSAVTSREVRYEDFSRANSLDAFTDAMNKVIAIAAVSGNQSSCSCRN